MSHEIICEHAILYRLYDEKLESFNGRVIKLENQYKTCYRFCRGPSGQMMLTVSDKSCKVHCDNVWMKRPNEKKARKLLSENYRMRLVEHEAAVIRLQRYIDILEERGT